MAESGRLSTSVESTRVSSDAGTVSNHIEYIRGKQCRMAESGRLFTSAELIRVSSTGTTNNHIEYVRSKQRRIAEYLGFPDQAFGHSNIIPKPMH